MKKSAFSHPLIAGTIAAILGGLVLLAVQWALENSGASPKTRQIIIQTPGDEKSGSQTSYGNLSPNVKDVGGNVEITIEK